MSAIIGLYHRDGQPSSSKLMETMVTTLSHRGPDGSAIWQDGSVGLGHLMRWNTPESLTEKLPLHDSKRRLAITSDARIDNREQLFKQLSITNHEGRSLSDSELLIHCYEKWGDACVDHLVGDFTFAIWDELKQQLFCAADHMGIRPFYYYIDDTLFAFSSEIKALLAIPKIPNKLNEEQFARYLVGGLFLQHKEQTCFAGISVLTAGKFMIVNKNRYQQKTYWTADFSKRLKLKSEQEYLEAFREVFYEAVHCRMRSAYPVASMLSGGLDSSSIASVAAIKLRESGKRLIGVSSVLPENDPGPEQDERYFIDLVRDKYDIDVSYVIPEGNGVYDGLEQAFRRAEHPAISSRHYVFTALQEVAARKGARVLLNGYAGELTATYPGKGYFSELAWRGRWVGLINELRAHKRITQRSMLSLLKHDVIRPFAPLWLENLHQQKKYGNSSWLTHSPIHPKFALKMKIREQILSGGINTSWHVCANVRTNQQRFFEALRGSTIGLADTTGPELLFPYLDKQLLEFGFSLPHNLMVQKGWKRYLIRAGLNGILPKEVQWRTSKAPFSPDYPRRFKAAQNEAKMILNAIGKDERVRDYIDIDLISKSIRECDSQAVLSASEVYQLEGHARIAQQGIYAIVFLAAHHGMA